VFFLRFSTTPKLIVQSFGKHLSTTNPSLVPKIRAMVTRILVTLKDCSVCKGIPAELLGSPSSLTSILWFSYSFCRYSTHDWPVGCSLWFFDKSLTSSSVSTQEKRSRKNQFFVFEKNSIRRAGYFVYVWSVFHQKKATKIMLLSI
jgi:hypothetical protein